MKAPNGTDGWINKRTMKTNLKKALKYETGNNILISSSRLKNIDKQIIEAIKKSYTDLMRTKNKDVIQNIMYLNKNNKLVRLFSDGSFK
jgi:hypothetical protein